MPIDKYHDPSFAQIYFYDTDLNNQLQRRINIILTLNKDMLRLLQNELHNINPFVKLFTNAGNCAKKESNISNMQLVIYNTHRKNMKCYNQLTASEVAVIILDNSNYKHRS